MLVEIIKLNGIFCRVYEFNEVYQAEDFAAMFNGTARAGKELNGKWVAVLY